MVVCRTDDVMLTMRRTSPARESEVKQTAPDRQEPVGKVSIGDWLVINYTNDGPVNNILSDLFTNI